MAGKPKNERGKRFGRLVVISVAASRGLPNHRKSYWNCQCDCGQVAVVNGYSLRSGTSKSCGCGTGIATSLRFTKHGSSKNLPLAWWKHRAKKRGIVVEISDDKAIEIISAPCWYCGLEYSIESRSYAGEIFRHNGIDRIDSTKGYTEINCVSCCKNCNYAKRSLSQTTFFDLIQRIYEKHFSLKKG